MSISNLSPISLLSLSIFFVGVAISIVCLIVKKKKQACSITGSALLIAAILLVSTAFAKPYEKNVQWTQNVDFAISESSLTADLIDAAVKDEQSDLPADFLLNNAPLHLNFFELGFVDDKFFVLRFEILNTSGGDCKIFQVNSSGSFLVSNSGTPICNDAALPLPIIKSLLARLDEQNWIETNINPEGSTLHIEYITKLDSFETDDELYIVTSDSIIKSETQSIDETSYIFHVMCNDRIVVLAVSAQLD